MGSMPLPASPYYTSKNGELLVGGVAVSEIASQYGTPLFIYDRSVIEKKWARLRQALPSAFSIYYSVKANPNQTILRCFLEKGAGLEIASAGEYTQARNAGCPAEKIVFAGPGKTESELEQVLSNGIGEIHLESLLEAQRVNAIAGKSGRLARVSLRINPSAEAEGGAMRMGGRPAPFGVDEEDVDRILNHLLELPSLDFQGIHLFTGTQILDFQILGAQYRKGIELARRIAGRLSRPLHTIDFGGGFGIPYFHHEKELDGGCLREVLEALLTEIDGDPSFAGTQFLVEPGRYLVGEAGVYLAKVSDIKISRGKKFLITDGGMHHHLAASGNLGQTIKRNYPIGVVNKMGRPPEETVEVVGPLCTPLDVLARSVELPSAEVGDLIGVFQSGAYARSASPAGFLSHPSPPEVWVDDGVHRLIRNRGQQGDYLRDQIY
jgi:diaminopimelate decarboxylase